MNRAKKCGIYLFALGVYLHMTIKRWVVRIVRIAAGTLAALVLVTAVAVQAEQWLMRWRCERLMADIHKIRLYQSNWNDAQALMTKWGAFGHYDGTCTAAECRYRISFGGLWGEFFDHYRSNPVEAYLQWVRGYGLLGGRISLFSVNLIVEDNQIRRVGYDYIVEAPANLLMLSRGGYFMEVNVTGKSGLRLAHRKSLFLGNESQLAEHPWYRIGRPPGTALNASVFVNYSSRIPVAELGKLEELKFDCITRLIGCKLTSQLLPLVEQAHLYDNEDESADALKREKAVPHACDIPVWALARDFTDVLAVSAKRQSSVHDYDGPRDGDVVTLREVLKGRSRWSVGSEMQVYPFLGDNSDSLGELPESIKSGKQYLLFYDDPHDDPPLPGLGLERCGVIEDTPENRKLVEQGKQLNDPLRGPERW